MDSLLANYASSDEEGEEHQQPQIYHNKPTSSIFTSLPPPKSSSSSSSFSLFNSLPPPKSNLPNPTQTLINSQSPKPITQFQDQQLEEVNNDNQSSSFFSSLPPPKSVSNPPPTNLFSSVSDPKPKKIVQFRPPINTAFLNSRDVDSEDDDDDDKEEKERKRSKEFTQTSSVKSFLSAIPAPKNTVALGAVSSSGSGRRSIIEADVPASNYNDVRTENEVNEVSVNSNAEGQWVDGSYSTSMEPPAGSSEYAVGGGGGDPSYWAPNSENSVYYDSYGYENYSHYGQYESKWIDKSEATSAPEISVMTESVIKIPGKRGRDEIPQDMIEVKQDELIKNRPREDQAKLTGIAFGPSYQPVSTKGKPTKLHKRKHQIGSLYFDMRQKEMELAERRAKGFLTKAETQAKYGW